LAQEAKLAEKQVAKAAAESEFAATKVPTPKAGDGLLALRQAAVKRKVEAAFRVPS
jgi:hypothetical protein